MIKIKLGIAYYNQGFFNIRKKYEDEFGENQSKLTIILGESGKEIEATINRTANPNQTPRIMAGKEYTVWIQENFKMGDFLKVEIVSNTRIKLLKNS